MSRKPRNPRAFDTDQTPDHRRLVQTPRGHVATELKDRGAIAEAESLCTGLTVDARRRVLAA